MCDRTDCGLCVELDAIVVREVTWCPSCGQREVAESLTLCVFCHAMEQDRSP